MGDGTAVTLGNGADGTWPQDLGVSKALVRDDEKDRILRRGDLARILGFQKGKLNDHKGDLSRILRSTPIEDGLAGSEQNGHSFVYDIELVLGGRLTGVPRHELQYTTAQEEGMTGDSRQRRKRKPTVLQDENKKNDASDPTKKKKKAPAKANTTKNASNKKRGSKNTGGTSGKKKTNETTKATFQPVSTNSNNGIGMFERHRREFERSLVRLQRLDVYHFFSEEDIPKEFDECYESPDPASENDTTMSGEPVSPTSSPKEKLEEMEKQPDPVTFPNHPPYNFVVLRKRLEKNRYILDRQRLIEDEGKIGTETTKINLSEAKRKRSQSVSLQHPVGIHWELFRDDVIGMCDSAIERNSGNHDDGTPGTLSNTADKIKTTMEQIYEKTGKRQCQEMELSNDAHRFTKVIEAADNREAAMQGKGWRRKAFPERQYERLKTDAVCAGLSELDERIATYELQTSLTDSFLGLSYTYNDTGQSEGWMKSIVNEGDDKNEQEKAAMALSSDDGVIKAQVAASMQSLLIAVQDRVMTENGVLEQKELRSANWESGMKKVGEQVVSTNEGDSDESKPEIVEQPVWGMDCYTRRNIAICLETTFDKEIVVAFTEKWLLPAINACPVDLAYNLANAARILEGLPFDTESSLNQRNGTTTEQWSTTLLGRALIKKIEKTAPPWLHTAARILRKAIESMGHDFFRVHPKGHGSIVLSPKIEPNRLVTFYRGEVYPSWRWGEKMDAISLIQQRNNLKPRLPDFYNMALERPQKDPRGYGLLFVDASRKSGYGSMLSHSCNPSCEVRVAAVNGKLTLAMTTLRELTIGDEVTFDYNAVTESLHEYQAAICLCGQSHCRGSFLHFATADCYQQVLNRNSPVAVRLSQLIKGCTKKVMSDDDVAILERHGFQTAAFGAVSVNRRKANNSDFVNSSLDSMDFVPIWLRTHVADILRYIEYERRALPIALISNQITRNEDSSDGGIHYKTEGKNVATGKEASKPDTATKSVDDKPIKGSKPEPSFFFFLRRRRESFIASLDESKKATMSSGEIEREMKQIASAEWKSFDEKAKLFWKQEAYIEWEKNGGKKKALLEQQRLKKLAQTKSGKQPKSDTDTKKGDSFESNEQCGSKKISFEAADAEGVTAMEQRIQQLTQALSRVGRVLDRHREELLRKQQVKNPTERVQSPAEFRGMAHSPLEIMPDEHVVAWMWNHEDGVIRTLLKMADEDICVSPDIKAALRQVEAKYSSLNQFGTPWDEGNSPIFPMTPFEGRKLLDEALLEFRGTLLDGIQKMAADIRNHRASAREIAKRTKERAEKRKEQAEKIDRIPVSSSDTEIRYAIKFVMNDMIDTLDGTKSDNEPEDPDITEPWLMNYNKRFKMEKAADLLLMYRRTSTFFRLVPYESLQSTSIEVYAREVGNAVPRSVIEVRNECEISPGLESDGSVQDVDMSDENGNKISISKEVKKSGFCEPEDIISEVVVNYEGDYVLSQILQWYNAGIDQKPGLPDLLGCALLPSMAGCWTIDATKGSNSATGIRTKYQSNTRPKLVEWFKDPFKRGSPWNDDLRRVFVEKDEAIDTASKCWFPIGSPVLDFLVTGDDCNLMEVLSQLGNDQSSLENNGSDGLLSSVDHGRPAQAVSNWVQCENPACQKWRKIPWHVDIDMLSEKFVCSDHVWGLNPPSCDAPAEDWDETTDVCVEADGSVKPNEVKSKDIKPKGTDKKPQTTKDTTNIQRPKTAYVIAQFKIGTRFDVLRPGKEKWTIANVVDVASDSNKVHFHFVKTQSKNDVWLEKDSNRIAPLHTHTSKPKPKPPAKPELHSIEEPKVSEVKSEKLSKLDKLKKFKEKYMQAKTSGLATESSASNNGVGESEATLAYPEPKRSKVTIEDEDDEGLFDEISSEDDDDESEDDTENMDFGVVDDIDEQEPGKPLTVTDHSSTDGSFKRDTELPRSEHSDIENECSKEGDQTNLFTIPKKKESNKKGSSLVIPKKSIPKKSIPSSSREGASLISNTARKAMLDKKGKKLEKKGTRQTKKQLSLSQSSTKDKSQNRKKKANMLNHGSPSSSRKAFSDLCHSPSKQLQSPSSIGSKRSHSDTNNGKSCGSPLSRSMMHPKHSYNDRYSIEQRRERELFRDSKEYTAQGEKYSYQEPVDVTHHPIRRSIEHDDVSPRSPSFERRRVTDSSDQSYSPRSSSGRNYDYHNRNDQYERDGYSSRQYDRSDDHYEDGLYVSRQRESGTYASRRSDSGYKEDGWSEDRSSMYSSKSDPTRREEYDHHGQYRTELEAGRRSNVDHRYRDDYDRDRDYSDRSQRGYSDRDVDQDRYRYRYSCDYETSYDANDSYREDERYAKRRRRDSEGRREDRHKRTFDGSDEYSRRLEAYSHSYERDYIDDDRRRDRHNR